MKLLFKQRFFSWFDSYDSYDEEARTVVTVRAFFIEAPNTFTPAAPAMSGL